MTSHVHEGRLTDVKRFAGGREESFWPDGAQRRVVVAKLETCRNMKEKTSGVLPVLNPFS